MEWSYVAVLAVLLGLIFLVLFVVSYMPMLERGQDSVYFPLVGRTLSRKVVCLLFTMMGTSVRAQELRKEAQEGEAKAKAESLHRDIHAKKGGGICFVGSSTFTYWRHLREDLADLPVFNAAFGGSTSDQMVSSANILVVPFNPKTVVYYCGSNGTSIRQASRQSLYCWV